MRVKIELLSAAILVIVIVGTLVKADPGKGWKCQGSMDCAKSKCYNAGLEGYACGLLTPIPHMICFNTKVDSDECTTVPKDCALVEYYTGGICDLDNAPYCTGTKTAVSKKFQEDGCN